MTNFLVCFPRSAPTTYKTRTQIAHHCSCCYRFGHTTARKQRCNRFAAICVAVCAPPTLPLTPFQNATIFFLQARYPHEGLKRRAIIYSCPRTMKSGRGRDTTHGEIAHDQGQPVSVLPVPSINNEKKNPQAALLFKLVALMAFQASALSRS